MAWSHEDNGFATVEHVFVRRWDGASWSELGLSATGHGISTSSSAAYMGALALDPQTSAPLVAWKQAVGSAATDSDVFFKRWTGSAWEELGGSGSGGGVSATPFASSVGMDLVRDRDGAPIVMWIDDLGSRHKTHVRRFDGQTWTPLGGDDLAGTSSNASLVTTKNGDPLLVWSGAPAGINLRRWNGTVWENYAGGAVQPAPERAEKFEIAVGPNDELAIVWPGAGENETAHRAYLVSWDGTTWRELGSVSGAGVHAETPSVVFDDRGRPIVAWVEGGEIMLRAWSGTAWDELAGSATGGGVSHSVLESARPDLAYRDHRLCVAWDELAAYASQVLVRCVDFARE